MPGFRYSAAIHQGTTNLYAKVKEPLIDHGNTLTFTPACVGLSRRDNEDSGLTWTLQPTDFRRALP